MAVKLKIIGTPMAATSRRGASSAEAASDFDDLADIITVKSDESFLLIEQRSVDTSAEAGASASFERELEDDDAIQVMLDDGHNIWLPAADLPRLMATERSSTGTAGRLEIGAHSRLTPSANPRGAQRGMISMAIKGLRLLGFDIEKKASDKLGEWITDKVESQRRPTSAVYRCHFGRNADLLGKQPVTAVPAPDPAHSKTPAPSADSPILVLLHGTAANTAISFSELWSGNAASTWQQLVSKVYSGHVYALEHRTLSEGPIENVCALLRVLRKGQTLHLLSHSRGGLVGELLCRAAPVDGGDPISDAEIDSLVDGYSSTDNPSSADFPARLRKQLLELRRLLQERQPRVERFVRVAAPARGTGLAGKRLDLLFNYLLWGVQQLAKTAGSEAQDVAKSVRAILMRTIKKRLDPSELPGLEVLVPSSPFLRLINNGREFQSELAVIQGDADISLNPLQFIATTLLNVFYAEDNDFVIETRSMLGGQRRSTPPQVWLAKGGHVNHFSYFGNDDSRNRTMQALHGDWQQGGFKSLALPRRDLIGTATSSRGGIIANRGSSAQADGGALCVLLPDFMASHLADANQRLWLDPASMVSTGLGALASDAGQHSIEPDGVLGLPYASLAQHLTRSRQLLAFDYDWRLGLEQGADRLVSLLDTELRRAGPGGRAIQLIGHGNGGLIALLAILRAPKLWQRICQHPDSRLLMAGSALQGSLSSVALLIARHPLYDFTDAAGVEPQRAALATLFSSWPGLLQTLPRWTTRSWFDPTTWQQVHQQDPRAELWQPPSTEALNAAHQQAMLLNGMPTHGERIHYLAGYGPQTPCELELGAAPTGGADTAPALSAEAVAFEASERGDGVVLWDHSVPDWASAWWLPDSLHGDLLDCPSAFNAITEILDRGDTSDLDHGVPPATATRSSAVATDAPRQMVDPGIWLFPSERDLAAAALTASHTDTEMRPHSAVPRCLVTILHDDLCSVEGPIMVGHYNADTINGSERVLDQRLDGMLSRSLEKGIYANQRNGVEIFTRAGSASHDGAVVVGLGAMGELTAPQLREALANALLRFALHRMEQQRYAGHSDCPLEITSLLIGTGNGALPIRATVQSLLSALKDTNHNLRAQDIPPYQCLRIVERYEDLALSAAHVLDQLRTEFHDDLQLDQVVTEGKRPLRSRYDFQTDPWWRIIRISQRDGDLYFAPIGERAANANEVQVSDQKLVDTLLQRATGTTRFAGKLGEVLYELLVPSVYKNTVAEQNGIRLLLDEYSARYPWEMLQDRLDRDPHPIATRILVTRQLDVDNPQPFRRSTSHQTALIIAAPLEPSLAPLPGAAREGQQVMERCQTGGFAVTPMIETQGGDNIIELMTSDYRILHLAGHGYLDNPKPGSAANASPVAVMALGNNIQLRPETVQALRFVPELVFINCCLIGKIDKNQEQLARDRHIIAAGVATAFLRLGARAVVAAGWEVDDDAALTFADTFYHAILSSRDNFGAAVLKARATTFEQHPDSNTWSAYQCYGDPAFRLQAQDPGHTTIERAPIFHSPREFASWIKDIGSGPCGDDSKRVMLDEVLQRNSGPEHDWLKTNPCVQEAAGHTLAEMKRFEEAIDYYNKAISSEAGDVSLTGVEQACNLAVRWLVTCNLTTPTAGEDDHHEQMESVNEVIERSIERLECLLRIGPTAERCSLLGSAHKHHALVLTCLDQQEKAAHAEVGAALKHALRHYNEASDLIRQQPGKSSSYPRLNAIAIAHLLRRMRFRAGIPRRQQALSELDAIEAEIPVLLSSTERDSELTNLQLLRHLIENTLNQGSTAALTDAYQRVISEASEKQRDSVIMQIRFLHEILLSYGHSPLEPLLTAVEQA